MIHNKEFENLVRDLIIFHDMYKHTNTIYGGSIFDGLKRVFSKVAQVAKNIVLSPTVRKKVKDIITGCVKGVAIGGGSANDEINMLDDLEYIYDKYKHTNDEVVGGFIQFLPAIATALLPLISTLTPYAQKCVRGALKESFG
jgi:hypothetical protein